MKMCCVRFSPFFPFLMCCVLVIADEYNQNNKESLIYFLSTFITQLNSLYFIAHLTMLNKLFMDVSVSIYILC